MTNLRLPYSVIQLYFSLAIPFLLAVAGTRLLLSEQFLHFEYGRPGFPADRYGFTAADRRAYGSYALHFLFSAEGNDYLAALRLPGDKCWNNAARARDCAMFSERELRHMVDVKRTTTLAFSIAAICALVSSALIFASRYKRGLASDIAFGIRRGCKLAMLSIAFAAVLSLAAWDHAFDSFHQLFFAEGTWRFPFSDSLIRLYPEQLFIDAALAIAAFVSLGAASILGALSLWDARVGRQG